MDALRRETCARETKLRAAREELDTLARGLAFDVLARGGSQCGVTGR